MVFDSIGLFILIGFSVFGIFLINNLVITSLKLIVQYDDIS